MIKYGIKKSWIVIITFLLSAITIHTVQATDTGSLLQPPTTVYVDDDYTPTTPGWGYDHFNKIQEGIIAVEINGTVTVYNGIYHENIEIIKSLTLTGEKASTTIIDGKNISDVAHIQNDWTYISGFTLTNGSNGILCSAENNQISGNIISNNYDWGIFLSGSYNVITENSIDNNGHITNTVGGAGGVYLPLAFSCKITKNNIRNNTETNAFFFKSMFNLWIRNFWDEPRWLPYPIFGIQAIIPPIFWLKIDWLPAKTPYEIA